MFHSVRTVPLCEVPKLSAAQPIDPRQEMFVRLPTVLQPFLTWLTAKPATGELPSPRTPAGFVATALLLVLCGVLISAIASACAVPCALAAILAGWLLTTSGLGIFQVVIFHHCAHGTVFRAPRTNVLVGRALSWLLLFKHFDAYRHDHMLHHNAKKLLTEEDEFVEFVTGMLGLRPAMPRTHAWRMILISLFSPAFHGRFLLRRVRSALLTDDRAQNSLGLLIWSVLCAAAWGSGTLRPLLVAWIVPLTILLQAATVFRILCEHRFPDPELSQPRGRDFVSHATTGVFPGRMPPAATADTPLGILQWIGWWSATLLVDLPVRFLVLVGDAPCHDYHHRRPASRRWANYIHARQHDIESSDFAAVGYSDSWGLFRTIDANLATLAQAAAFLAPAGQDPRAAASIQGNSSSRTM